MELRSRLAQYVPYRLQADLSHLSAAERGMLPWLVKAAQAMDEPFWIQNYGDRHALLAANPDPEVQRLLELNYGPWDRLRGNEPFLGGVGPKLPGANFYPPDITIDELEASAAAAPELKSPYSMVRRGTQGQLVAIPYHRFFQPYTRLAAEALRRAAALCENPSLKTYLFLRADALLDDDYQPSDFAWMDLGDNTLEILVGPMEVEDRLVGLKTAYAATLLIRDWQATERLNRYIELAPRFQELLPVADVYKQTRPGLSSQLGVYDAIYFAGNDKAATPLGAAWPNDEEVQLARGVRSLLLQNTIRARFEYNLAPLANLLIDPVQRADVTAEANFMYVMLHEIAHGLGIKRIITSGASVSETFKELHHPVEEAKADLLALVMAAQLCRWGQVSRRELQELSVTTLVRQLYNCDSLQALLWLNVFRELGACRRDDHLGTYSIDAERLPGAAEQLAGQILRMQGDGDYTGAQALFERYGQPDRALRADLDRIDASNLPMGLSVEQELF